MNRFRARLVFFAAVFAVAAAVVTVRLFVVQVLQGPRFAARSRSQSQERCLLPACRGAIYDRKGRVLAEGTQRDLSLKTDLLGSEDENGKGGQNIKRVYPLQEAAGPLV